jgi:hypothetical protein
MSATQVALVVIEHPLTLSVASLTGCGILGRRAFKSRLIRTVVDLIRTNLWLWRLRLAGISAEERCRIAADAARRDLDIRDPPAT